MGRMLLILVIGGGLLVSVTTLNISRSNNEMVYNSVQENQTREAKNYAESGIGFALRYLADDTTWTGINNKQLMGGTVSISVSNTNSQYFNGPNVNLTSARLITSIGVVGNQYDTIRAVVQLPSGSTNGTPPFMNYAAAAGNNLVLGGNDLIQDDNNSLWNSNCQANGDFDMGGWDMIKGFVTYGGEAEADKAGELNTYIVPNQNPYNLSSCSQVSKLNIPTFNPDNYKSKATVIYNGNQSISGNITMGTKSNPQIIYVGGDLTLSGNVSGYGIFIVKGNLTVKGNVTITAQDPSCSNLGLYTAGDLNTNGGVTIKAQIFTGGNANLSSNCSVYGSVTSVGTVNLSTNVNINYRPANANLTAPFWTGSSQSSSTTRPVIVSYLE